MLLEKLGRRIADLRRANELTQVQLARKMDRSVAFISLVERGVNAPTVAGLERLARLFKVDVRELFTFEGLTGRKPRPVRSAGKGRAPAAGQKVRRKSAARAWLSEDGRFGHEAHGRK